MTAEAMAQWRWLASMRIRQGSLSIAGRLANRVGEKCFGIDAMSGVVRTGVDATGLFQIGAQIARGGFLFHDGFAAAGMVRVFVHDLERMQIDIAVGAISRAQAATDTPVFDDDF